MKLLLALLVLTLAAPGFSQTPPPDENQQSESPSPGGEQVQEPAQPAQDPSTPPDLPRLSEARAKITVNTNLVVLPVTV